MLPIGWEIEPHSHFGLCVNLWGGGLWKSGGREQYCLHPPKGENVTMLIFKITSLSPISLHIREIEARTEHPSPFGL